MDVIIPVARLALYRPVFNLTVTHQQTDLLSRAQVIQVPRPGTSKPPYSRMLYDTIHQLISPQCRGAGCGRAPSASSAGTNRGCVAAAGRQTATSLPACLPVCQTTPRVAN